MNKQQKAVAFIQNLLLALLLVGLGVIATWVSMTIMQLQEENARYEQQVTELKTSVTILKAVKDQIKQENETLSK